jgi:hypothetical protein
LLKLWVKVKEDWRNQARVLIDLAFQKRCLTEAFAVAVSQRKIDGTREADKENYAPRLVPKLLTKPPMTDSALLYPRQKHLQSWPPHLTAWKLSLKVLLFVSTL